MFSLSVHAVSRQIVVTFVAAFVVANYYIIDEDARLESRIFTRPEYGELATNTRESVPAEVWELIFWGTVVPTCVFTCL